MGFCSSTDLNKLKKLQNRDPGIATNSPYDASSQPLLVKLGWQTIRGLIVMETAMIVHRPMNNESPKYLMSLFEMFSQHTILILNCLLKTSSGQKCISYRGAQLWNNLSADTKQAQAQIQLKKEYKIRRNPFANSITF